MTVRIRPGVAALVALIGAGLASAEEPKSVEELNKLSLAELLELPVSVASRSDEALVQAPSSVTVFRREELQAMGINSLEEMLNFVPGFQATREVEQGTADRIGARGRSSAASESAASDSVASSRTSPRETVGLPLPAASPVTGTVPAGLSFAAATTPSTPSTAVIASTSCCCHPRARSASTE